LAAIRASKGPTRSLCPDGPDRELLAVVQPSRAQRQIIFKFKIEQGPKLGEIPVRLPDETEKVKELYNDSIIGFNKFGKEAIRVTVDGTAGSASQGKTCQLHLKTAILPAHPRIKNRPAQSHRKLYLCGP
jgi:hypothetical protein